MNNKMAHAGRLGFYGLGFLVRVLIFEIFNIQIMNCNFLKFVS